MCRVVNLNQEEYDVYIGREGKGEDGYFGNPYSKNAKDPEFRVASRTEAIAKHRVWAIRRYNTECEFRFRINALYGKRLGCFCHPKGCHGDVYAELANGAHSPLF